MAECDLAQIEDCMACIFPYAGLQCCPPRWPTSGCIPIFYGQRNGGAKGLETTELTLLHACK